MLQPTSCQLKRFLPSMYEEMIGNVNDLDLGVTQTRRRGCHCWQQFLWCCTVWYENFSCSPYALFEDVWNTCMKTHTQAHPTPTSNLDDMSVVHPLHQYETPEADPKKYLHTYANVMTICLDIDWYFLFLFVFFVCSYTPASIPLDSRGCVRSHRLRCYHSELWTRGSVSHPQV